MYETKLCKFIFDNYLELNRVLLDVGYGGGIHLKEFEKLGLMTLGVEKKDGYNAEYQKLPFLDESIDYIWCKSVLEHIQNPENILKECYRVLKKGGKIIILTPDWESIYRDFFIDYTHVVPYTKKSLIAMLKDFNFKQVKVSKFYQLPFLWKYPFLRYFVKFIAFITPDCFKWKDEELVQQRVFIRFAKELMLLGTGEK
jgi:SAM-dependent methyltransferase